MYQSQNNENNKGSKGPAKCRIPQRLPNPRLKSPNSNRDPPNQPEHVKPRLLSPSSRQEPQVTSRYAYPVMSPNTMPKKSPPPGRKVPNELMPVSNNTKRQTITIPASTGQQRGHLRTMHTMKNTIVNMDLCDLVTSKQGRNQEEEAKIKEEMELQELSDSATYKEDDSYDSSNSDRTMELRIGWQEKIVHFEKLKNNLAKLQAELVAVYGSLREHHANMQILGHAPTLPPADELRIMNITKLPPEQLLQLCAVNDQTGSKMSKWSLTVDMGRLYHLPGHVIAAGEQTLTKRREIIDWFDNLAKSKGQISMRALGMKLKEFSAENEMLENSLQKAKADLYKELNEVIEFLRKQMNNSIALQLRVEAMTYENSQLNGLNTDLRKQLHTIEHLRSQNKKARVEELEKELKEEKSKQMFARERLSRAEGQVKMHTERATQLESALQLAQSKTWSLERTVQELKDQNQLLQENFDKELTKLTESIGESTERLEEISKARLSLQTEKEELEKQIQQLSEHYNDSMNATEEATKANVAKLLETEKNLKEVMEERDKLKNEIETMNAKLGEAQQECMEIRKQSKEKEDELSKLQNVEIDLDATKDQLLVAKNYIDVYKEQLEQQSEEIKSIESNFKKMEVLIESLKQELQTKEEHITELEDKQRLYDRQIQESEEKLKSYREQVNSLKEQVNSLKEYVNKVQKDFGEFENLDEFHEMIKKQRAQLIESKRKNEELADAIHKKNQDLEQMQETMAEMQQGLEERERVIKVLSNKDDEQTNIIKLLRDNLEMRAQADSDMNQKIYEKDTEIESLKTNVETRKQQISQLEKIILTLEDQTRKASLQIHKYQELIATLEKKITEYESQRLQAKYDMKSAENIDNLMKLIEDEIESPAEQEYAMTKRVTRDRNKREKLGKFECHEGNSSFYPAMEPKPAKIFTSNYAKKSHVPINELHRGDDLDRKKGITNIDSKKWVAQETGSINARTPTGSDKTAFNDSATNMHYILNNQLRDEKKSKMFKLAGHRL